MLTSAGLLLYRQRDRTEVFLVHPGGPYWVKKDAGAWSIPKGLYGPEEDPLQAALREFAEETGFSASPPFLPLGAFEVSRDKTVTVFAAEGDCREEDLVSNTFAMEWPPRSGQMKNFSEVDRGAWFVEEEALCRITPGQRAIVAALFRSITASEAAPAPSRSRRKRSRIGRSDAPN